MNGLSPPISEHALEGMTISVELEVFSSFSFSSLSNSDNWILNLYDTNFFGFPYISHASTGTWPSSRLCVGNAAALWTIDLALIGPAVRWTRWLTGGTSVRYDPLGDPLDAAGEG
ncbi:hypothetical protein GCM10020219_084390 [Nonomuraea dietziae]